jgi:hypothetical protein
MSKQRLTLFLCQGKDCRKAWRKLTDSAPEKWLKRHVEEAGLPYKLRVVETACQDHCEDAACLCAVRGPCAALETRVRSEDDADRVLAALRSCAETADHVLLHPSAFKP